MNHTIFQFSVILLSSLSFIGLVQSTENESFPYCECTFTDKGKDFYSSGKKINVGWVAGDSNSNIFVRINNKKNFGFIKKYEQFSEKLGSKGEFLLLNGTNKIKGNLKVTSNCVIDSGNCENTGFKGNAEVTINGVTSKYNITGGCGC